MFSPEENFLWDNLLCFGQHNALRSSIKAHIRSVTVEILQKFICPNMVIDTKLTDKCRVPQSIISIICDINSLSDLSSFTTIFLAHSKDLSPVIAAAPTLTALAVTASN